jgi:subtilisin family serine protease
MSMSETGPRRVPVLLMLDKQEPLVASATAFRERLPRIDIRAAKVPKAVELDPFFPAVPVGPGNRNITLESTAPEASEQFVVRAFVMAEKPEDVPERVDGRQVFADPVIEPFPICPGDPASGGVVDVKAKLATAKLAASGLDGNKVAIAIVDTGVNLAHLTAKLGGAPRFDAGNSWTPKGVTTLPGNHPVNHGTMCAFDALIAAPNATLLDYPVLVTPAQGGSTMSGTVGVALLAYAQLVVGWAVAFAAGGTQKYSGLVVSNSWGVYHPSWDLPPGHRGRYIDNPNHPFHLQVSALNRSGVDIIFAAGNCGAPCPSSKCQNLTTGNHHGCECPCRRAHRCGVRCWRSACRLFLAGAFDWEHAATKARPDGLHPLSRLRGIRCRLRG